MVCAARLALFIKMASPPYGRGLDSVLRPIASGECDEDSYSRRGGQMSFGVVSDTTGDGTIARGHDSALPVYTPTLTASQLQ